MTSAKERAVEAGAIALCRIVHPGRFANDFDYWNCPYAGEAMKSAFRLEADDCLRAAFPILADDVVAWHDEQAHAADRYAKQAPTLAARQQWEFVADTHRSHAATLRARIQQMAEAL